MSLLATALPQVAPSAPAAEPSMSVLLRSWVWAGREVEWREGRGQVLRGCVRHVGRTRASVLIPGGKTRTVPLPQLLPASALERGSVFHEYMARAIASPFFARQR